MYPWGHLGVGYVAYTIWCRLFSQRPPPDKPTVLLVFATQLPDLIDKTLQFVFGIYDGRAVGHSLLVMVSICAVLFFLGHRYQKSEFAIAFSFGVITHIIADTVPALFPNAAGPKPTYLLWPLLRPPSYPVDTPSDHINRFIATLQKMEGQSLFQLVTNVLLVEIFVVLTFGLIWAIDGFPGTRTLWRMTFGRLAEKY
jgi:hypothetical protein